MRLRLQKVFTLVLGCALAGGVLSAATGQSPSPAPVSRPGSAEGSKVAATLAADVKAASPAGTAAVAKGPVEPSAMQGVSLEGMSDAQKQLVMAILNEHGCDCSCGMKLAVCRRDDSKCGRSLQLANQVVDLVKKGKTREEIVKTALASPTKFVQFPLTAGDAPSIGPANAKVTILHYVDYQCPFCAKASPTMEQIVKDYPSDVRIVYKMHPLDFHAQASIAAQAALAAHAQGKFLPMHKKLFENSSSLSRDKIMGFAKDIALDLDRFTKDLDAGTYKTEIQKQASEAQAIGASGTPASFVNGRYLSGAKPYNIFKDMIDEELKWAREGKRPAFTTGKNVKEASAQAPGVARGPDPDKVYDIPVGQAPVIGPPKAKVSILHYLDYQ